MSVEWIRESEADEAIRLRATAIERFFAKVIALDDECWQWLGTCNKAGYGFIRSDRIDHANVYAHRFAYEAFVGPIPEGLQIDHLCCRPGCVNPDHLEAVTQGENVRRGYARRRQAAA